MARKRPKINLNHPVKPRSGDLEGLFSSGEDVEQAAGMQLLAIRLDAIQPDPDQPRNTFPEGSLRELSESIRQDGVIQPIEVTEIRPNQYVIVHGERRWRAARLAGLETIPAVVRRRDYDEITRFVRQLVENIQREDLNDIDRAAGLIRLRDLMQEELDRALEEDQEIAGEQPWGKKMTWSKVGQRLGYSRQRIHQLIQLLNLPDEIKDDLRDGRISERDTRIYRGLKPSQQRALHKARLAGDIEPSEVKDIARLLKKQPDRTVYQTIRELRRPPTREETAVFTAPDSRVGEEVSPPQPAYSEEAMTAVIDEEASLADLAPGSSRVTNTVRLGYIRQHLARIQRDLVGKERVEVLRLLRLIERDVNSLIKAVESDQ